MKKSLKVFILVLMLGLLCVVVGCSGGEAGSTKIIITGETTGVVGEELTLSARISPQSNETITWASSDESTATVAEGVVSLLKEGNVTITASAAGVKGEVTITIKAAPVKATSVSITGATTVAVGGNIQLTATVAPDTATNKAVTWKSENNGIAVVDDSGKVTAKSLGTVKIFAEADGATGEHVITVTGTTTLEIVSSAETNELGIHETCQLEANVVPVTAGEGNKLVWRSSDESIATVTQEGIVTGVAAGKVVISIHLGLLSAEYEMEIKYYPVEDILITGSVDIPRDSTSTLSAEVLPENATYPTVTWSSQDESIATVDPVTGEVYGVSDGDVVIVATADKMKKEITVHVLFTHVQSVTITGDSTGEVGRPIQLTATITPENATDKTVVWSSSDDSKATVDPETGEVMGLQEGEVEIIATCEGNVTARHKITFTVHVLQKKLTIGQSHFNLGIWSADYTNNVLVYDKTFSGSSTSLYVDRVGIDYDETSKQYVVTEVLKSGVADSATIKTHDYLITIAESSSIYKTYNLAATIEVGCGVKLPQNINFVPVSATNENIVENIGIEFYDKLDPMFLPAMELYVAQVGENYYTKISDAVAALAAGSTLKIGATKISDAFAIEFDNVVIESADAARKGNIANKISLKDGIKGVKIQNLEFTGLGQIEATGVVENLTFTGNNVHDITIEGGEYTTSKRFDQQGFLHLWKNDAHDSLRGLTVTNNTFTNLSCFALSYRGAHQDYTILIDKNVFKNMALGAVKQEGGFNAGKLIITNNEFTNDDTTVGYCSILFRQMGSAAGVTHEIVIENNTFTNIGKDFTDLAGYGGSAAIVSGSYQEAKTSILNIKIRFNSFVGCTNGVYLRDNGGTADMWVSQSSYNLFKDIKGYIFGGDASGKRNALDHNVFLDAEGTALTDEVLATKLTNIKENTDVFATEEEYKTAVETVKAAENGEESEGNSEAAPAE